ncbi:MAG: hypothetical protein GDA42_03125 [Ekhidna sp.]|nr:hypothetical protein [Ekhidna sp.]
MPDSFFVTQQKEENSILNIKRRTKMIVDAVIVGLLFYFTFPLLTGYCAHQYGRSFVIWFTIGCIFPIVSFFILFFIISWDEKTTPKHKLSRRERVESEKLVKNLVENLSELSSTGTTRKDFSKQRT